jgi:uncharacterized membrane protein HdeD (DUF308 family)
VLLTFMLGASLIVSGIIRTTLVVRFNQFERIW